MNGNLDDGGAKYSMRYTELTEARPWKHYTVLDAGVSVLDGPEGPVEVTFDIGLVHTGRTRTFHSYFAKIILSTDREFLGTDPYSLRQALRNAAEACERAGYTGHFVGLSDDFQETGLSWNSGWGYVLGSAKIHMMEPSVAPGHHILKLDETSEASVPINTSSSSRI